MALSAISLVALLAQSAQAATYSAVASVSPHIDYLNDTVGTVFTFTVRNTGTSTSIGAVEIQRPDSFWTVAACLTAPSGWTIQQADPKCRYRSGNATTDDIQPGQSAQFQVKLTSLSSTQDRTGSFQVTVSSSNQFDNPSLLLAANEGVGGLDITAYSFQVLDAVVANAPATPNSACPAPNKTAVTGSTHVIVICGKNRTSGSLTPSAAYSGLGGDFLSSSGTFSSGPISANSSSSVVLGNWSGATVTSSSGSGKVINAQIGASAVQTSPVTQLTGYTAINQPPHAVDDGPYTTLEDQTLTVAAPGVLGNDTDAENDPLTASLASPPANGNATVNADGSFQYVPAPNSNGPDSFTYTVSDNHGGTDTGTVSISVTAVNDAPSFTAGPDQTVLEDSGSHTVSPWATGISAGPGNESGQTVHFVVTGNTNPGLFSTPPSVSPSGDLSFASAPDANGNASVTVVLKDDGGTANGGQDTSGAQTFAIHVTAVNDPPSFDLPANPNQSVQDNAGPQTVTGFATNISPGPADEAGQTVTFQVSNDNAGLFSSAPAIDASGTLTYTPASSPSGGVANVSVTAKDNGGTANGGQDTSPTQMFTITVTHTNQPPTANDVDFGDAVNNTLFTVGTTGSGPEVHVSGSVLDGASDPDGPSPLTAVAGTIATANGGTVHLNADGTFDYISAPGFAGTTDTFQYRAQDGANAQSSPATVTVHLTGDVVWYVDNAAGSPGDGRSTAPFDSLSPLRGAGDADAAGQTIFLYQGSGTYGGGLGLEDGQSLIGEPNGLVVAGHTLVAAGGTAPTIANGSGDSVGLASGNTVQGIHVGSASGTGLKGSSVGTATVGTTSAVSVDAGSGTAVDLSTGTLDVELASASSSGSSGTGIRLSGTTGTFTVNGGTLENAAGDGVSLTNAAGVSLSSMTIRNNAGSGVNGSGVNGFSLSGSMVQGNGTNAVTQAGLKFANLLGSSSISTSSVFGSPGHNASIVNTSGSLTLNVSGSTFRDNSAATGSNGLLLIADGTSTVNATLSGDTFRQNRVAGVQAQTLGGGTLTVGVSGGTFQTNFNGVDIDHASTGSLTATVDGATFSSATSIGGAPINLFLGSGAGSGAGSIFRATVSNNTVSNGDSVSAPGIWFHTGSSNGNARLAITGNNVSAVANRGISVEAGAGASKVDATVTGNTVTLANLSSLEGIFVQSGTLSTDTTQVCADIRTNTAISVPTSDIRVRQRFTSTTLRLPGYGGSGTDDTAVQNFLKGQNTVTDVLASHASATGFGGGGACAGP